MLDNRNKMAALIGSRICHDLISPLGAISNGLELLELSGMPQSPEFDLINDAVQNANAKLRFLRIAFSDADPDASLPAYEIKTMLKDNYNDPRMSIQLHADDFLSAQNTKLIYLAILCFEKIMPYGGHLDVYISPNGFQLKACASDFKSDHFIDFDAMQFIEKEGASFIQFKLANAEQQRRAAAFVFSWSGRDLICDISL